LHSEEFSVIENNGSDIIVNNEIDLSEVKTENPEENKKPRKMSRSKNEIENTVLKTYRFRVKEKLISSSLWKELRQSFGNTRFVWNHFLNQMNHYRQSQITIKNNLIAEGKEIPEDFKNFLSFVDLCSLLTKTKNEEKYSFLYLSASQPQQSVLKNLSNAMAEFAKGKKGIPQFKIKGKSEDSLFFKQASMVKIDLKDKTVILPKFKEKLHIRFHRIWSKKETPKTVSLTWNGSQIFINIQTEYQLSQEEKDKQQDNFYLVNYHHKSIQNNISGKKNINDYIIKNKSADNLLTEFKEQMVSYDLGVKKMIVTNNNQVFHLSKQTQSKLHKIADKIILLQKKSSEIYEINKKKAKFLIKKEKNNNINDNDSNFKKNTKGKPQVPFKFHYRTRNYIKLQNRIKRLYVKASNIKKDFLHKVSYELSKNHTYIFRENLDIKSMTMSKRRMLLLQDEAYLRKRKEKMKANPWLKDVYDKRKLNKSILNVGWGMFNSMIEYKVRRNFGVVVKINPAYTSQYCSSCQHIAKENRKSQSDFVCQSCGFSANADFNAALNIYKKGFDEMLNGNIDNKSLHNNKKPKTKIVIKKTKVFLT